jgi:predicted MPP superfamily phosphohydrolase
VGISFDTRASPPYNPHVKGSSRIPPGTDLLGIEDRGEERTESTVMLFLLPFFLLYSALHLYIFMKMKVVLSLGAVTTPFVLVFMAIMVIAPVTTWIFESRGFEFSARLIAYIGYTWMAVAFLFFSFSLLIDLYGLFVYTSGLVFQKDLSRLQPPPGLSLVILLVAGGIALHGYLEAGSIRNETVIIESPKIPKEIGSIIIAQISDVHLGLIVREERLERILKEVRRAEPDILVSTGDLVDGQIGNLKGLAGLLEAINPRYGKFAVTGNHEFYAGLHQAMDFTQKAGFTVLRGEAVNIGGILTIAGVDDPAGGQFGLFQGVSEGDLLSGLSRERFTVLLKHRPAVGEKALGLFDLQLSGHTHQGQIFPFSLVTRLFFPAGPGLVHLSGNSYLYVSRGSGTWGPPIRFLSPPEVTVIKLIHKDT